MANIFYMIDSKDQNEFEYVLESIVDANYKKFTDPLEILCQSKAEDSLGYKLLEISLDDTLSIDEKIENITEIKDLKDTMYQYIKTSGDLTNKLNKTFDQIFSMWRN